MKYKFGIDLGGTKIEIIALDSFGNQCFNKRIATDYKGDNALDYFELLQKIKNLITLTQNTLKINQDAFTLGIGTPGAITNQGLIKNSNSQCLNAMAFKQDLEKLLQRKINIANDANCFALSEAIDGAGANAEIVFGVIISTGCGGGIVINKTILNGVNSITGEWGHNPLPYQNYQDINLNENPGKKCYCGRHGCIETWLSGDGLVNDYFNIAGIHKTAQEIANNNNKKCVLAIQRYEKRLAKSLAGVINILDPQVIVLGGGLSQINSLYKNVPKLWEKYIFSNNIKTKLLPPKHGDSSGVRGAAML